MNIGTTLYVTTRKEWRSWLAKNHKTAPDIWLIFYRKDSGKPRLPYNAAVEEALCYGWIDSIVKKPDEESFAQRFSPRKKGSQWSALNIERLRRLWKAGKMRRAGLEAAGEVLRIAHPKSAHGKKGPKIPLDILKALKKDPAVWKNFSGFPSSYKRIRIGWIDDSRQRKDVFRTRLNYFVRMTKKGKRFGMVR